MDERFCECCTCGYRWRRGLSGDHSCIEHLKKDLQVTEQLLEQRQKLLDAIPECEAHGKCVPHALEWIEKAKLAMAR